MMVAIASLPFLLAAISAALMGFAIQRGRRCCGRGRPSWNDEKDRRFG
jgi:hypothetical protein